MKLEKSAKLVSTRRALAHVKGVNAAHTHGTHIDGPRGRPVVLRLAPRLRLQAGLLRHPAVAEDTLDRHHLVFDLYIVSAVEA